jgi:hypothetical protein
MKRSKHQRLTRTVCRFDSTESYGRSARSSVLLLLVGLWTLDFGLWTSFAAETTNSGPGRTDYRNFEIIPKRNIFNPRRSPDYKAPERPQRARSRTETLALVGVMSYGKGPMAFFDGSRSDYRKVLKTNETVAGFKVTSIDSSSVKLASNTNEIEMQLGMQLAREDEGEWKLSMRPESLESSYARATPMRSASQVNADRQSEADQNANPFANAIGNFFGNRGGNGFPFPGGGNFTGFPTQTAPADTQTQPTATAAPAETGDVIARMIARRRQETGDPPQDQAPGPTSDQGGTSGTQRGPSPQSPPNQPGQQPTPQQVPNGQLPPGQQQLPDQSNQQPLDQSGQRFVDQFGRPLPIQPDQLPPNQ